MTSHHPKDVENRYCGNCHKFIDDLDVILRGASFEGTGHEHDYLSTACLHGQHTYCQSDSGAAGAKIPGKCKFCPALCSCECHGWEEPRPAGHACSSACTHTRPANGEIAA
jgi:hypothetical protein